MSIETEQHAQYTLVKIKEDMTIYHAKQQKDALLPKLNQSRELHIDLSGVSEVDSAGVQLLLMLKAESIKRGVMLKLLKHSEAIIEVFELLHLGAHFGDPVVIPAHWKQS